GAFGSGRALDRGLRLLQWRSGRLGGRFGRPERAALREHPGLELLPRYGLERDRHVRMPGTAQLRALAVIDAGLLDRQQALVDAAGHRVDLEPQARDGERMDHVSGCALNPTRFAAAH